MCVGFICHVGAGACRGWKRAPDLLELELEVVHRGWELNFSSLEEPKMFLTAESSLQILIDLEKSVCQILSYIANCAELNHSHYMVFIGWWHCLCIIVSALW